ncbi:TonB-dependent receptor [Iodidimonas sp. SYSU 1G8]|uniref:TonB-dependent receptor n=1 Tax=Iodidimonas sp. SYSU 1G8 TaxID=3133967 RepID=UPI0031FE4D36
MGLATGTTAAPADQIVVTATREATLRTALPESTGVLDEKALAEAHPTHPSEIMGRIPGVYQAWLSGNHHTTVIRQPINFNPLYLYLENGVPKQAAGFFETNAMFDMNVSQAARMEITKGPGTALYGSDAIAGVINVMTPLPNKEFSGSVEAQGSTRGYKQGLISLGGTSGSHGVRADVNIAHDSGWRDDTESDHQMGTFTWLIDNGGPLTVRNVLVAVRANQDSPGSNLGRADYENNPRINLSPIDFRLVESLRFYSHMDYDMGDTLVSLTPFFRWGRTELLPFFALAFDPHYFEASATSFGGQFKVRHDFSDKLRLILGADVDYTTGNRVDTRIAPIRDGAFYVDFTEIATVYDFNAKALTLSPYAHAEWQALPRLRLTAGIRYDYAHYDYTNNLSDVVSPTALHNRPPDQKLHFDDWSPKAGITYDITDTLNAYVSWRRAFRVPTTSQLFRPGRSTQSTGLKPVKAESFEAGLRGTWDRVQFEVSAYTMEITDDILVFTNNATGVRDIRNSGNTRHKGVEAGITVAITPTLEIAGAYARNDHHFIEWAPVPGVDLSGNKINRAPKDIGSARIVWRPAFLNGGRLEASYEHLGSYYLDDDNTRTYEGHDLIHVSGSIFVTEGVELFLRLHNLLNERYATNGRYTAFGGDELKPGLPRTVFGGVGVTF